MPLGRVENSCTELKSTDTSGSFYAFKFLASFWRDVLVSECLEDGEEGNKIINNSRYYMLILAALLLPPLLLLLPFFYHTISLETNASHSR